MRVGTASQPASIAAESEAAHGEMEFLHNENAKLKKENEKLKKNMDKLASYAFGRFNALAAETKELKRLYEAARSNCKEGIVLPECEGKQSDEPLLGKVFARMYEQAKELTIDDSSGEEGEAESQDLSGFGGGSESGRSKKSLKTGASMSHSY